jgi:hypothetical protein
MSERLKTLLIGRQTEILFLDEFQNIVRDNERNAYNVAGFVKELLNGGPCPIVMVGTPMGEAVVDADDQLDRRSIGRVFLSGFDIATEKGRGAFEDAVVDLIGKAQASELEPLRNEDDLFRMHVATRGLFGRVVKLLENALRVGDQMELTHVNRQVLRYAYQMDRPSDDPRWVNPFSQDLDRPALAELATRRGAQGGKHSSRLLPRRPPRFRASARLEAAE